MKQQNLPMKSFIKVFDLSKKLQNETMTVGISDIEKQLKRYPVYQALQKSRGEFCGYRVVENRVHLFVDRFCARNIYYRHCDKWLFVSNNMNFMLDEIKKRNIYLSLDDDAVKIYQRYQIPIDNRMIYKYIYRLMPAQTLMFYKENKLESKIYWELEFGNEEFDPNKLKSLIQDAIEFRNDIAKIDVTYLSGGIDSTTICCLSDTKKAYTGCFDIEGYSELEHVANTTKFLRSNKNKDYYNYPCLIDTMNFPQLLEEINNILPNPMCGLGIINQSIVGKEIAHRYIYRTYTGEGGDEVFLGYNWNTYVLHYIKKMEELKRDKFMLGYEQFVRDNIKNTIPALIDRIVTREFVDIDYKDTIESKCNEYFISKNDSPINVIHYINLRYSLPAILTADECVGLYTGVEPVSPFVDHKLVEYVCSIDPKVRSYIPKGLLKCAIKGEIPDTILNRTDKMGFPVPVKEWEEMFGKFKFLEEKLGRPASLNRNNWAELNIKLCEDRCKI